MMQAEGQKGTYGTFGCCGPAMMKYRRSCGTVWGIMLILVGFLWMTSEMGWFNPELFWPAIFLAAGILMLTLSLTRERRFRTNNRQNNEGRK
jgi:hypothetical protein